MNNIMKYCQNQKCLQTIEYNKLKTSGNDPSVTKRMRYSQYVNTIQPRTLSYAKYVELYGIPQQKPYNPPRSTLTQFNTFYF